MTTTVDLTDQELQELRELTHTQDPAEAVREAMRSYVRYAQRRLLMDLSGRAEMVENWRELEEAEMESQR